MQNGGEAVLTLKVEDVFVISEESIIVVVAELIVVPLKNTDIRQISPNVDRDRVG